MLRKSVELPDGRMEVLLMDSISLVKSADQGRVVISGSHGGTPSAEYAVRGQLKAVIFNDAGIGKENAGVKGLEILDDYDIIALAADCDTARIGDALDVYEYGIISTVNTTAMGKGLNPGITVKEAAAIISTM